MADAIHDAYKDIIGKEFTGIEFKSDGTLIFKNQRPYIGKIGTVIIVNNAFDRKYTLIEFKNGDAYYYFTEDVISQIKEKNTNYVPNLYKEIFKILKQNDRYFNKRKST